MPSPRFLPARNEVQLLKLLPASWRDYTMDSVHPDRHFHYHGRIKRLKYHRRAGWAGGGNFSPDRRTPGHFAHASGNFFFADYLNIMYIPQPG